MLSIDQCIVRIERCSHLLAGHSTVATLTRDRAGRWRLEVTDDKGWTRAAEKTTASHRGAQLLAREVLLSISNEAECCPECQHEVKRNRAEGRHRYNCSGCGYSFVEVEP